MTSRTNVVLKKIRLDAGPEVNDELHPRREFAVTFFFSNVRLDFNAMSCWRICQETGR